MKTILIIPLTLILMFALGIFLALAVDRMVGGIPLLGYSIGDTVYVKYGHPDYVGVVVSNGMLSNHIYVCAIKDSVLNKESQRYMQLYTYTLHIKKELIP